MRLVLAASAALVLSCAVASADGDVMSSRFGNTLVAKTPNGQEVHMYYNADHTFTGKVIGMDYQLQGTWSADSSGNICLTYNPPPPGVTNPTCVPAEAHQIGDTWTSGGRTITLVQGIQ
jgi:hypothetical protein